MINLIRTNSGNKDFIELVALLDIYLAEKDGEEHAFYNQFNKLSQINNVVLVYNENTAIGCGAIKEFSPGVMEVKRMYTNPEYRGHGIASKVLTELEKWGRELSCTKCLLETGKRQVEAIEFYKKNGYSLIPCYGQYKNAQNSLCFEKSLIRE